MKRFHYILKSGLLIEQLQVDNFVRLVDVLQLYELIAWHLLWLQRLARVQSIKPLPSRIFVFTISILFYGRSEEQACAF